MGVIKGKLEIRLSPFWRFPRIVGTFYGDPYQKDYTLWGLYWGPTVYGNDS